MPKYLLRRASKKDGQTSADLYNAIDNLIASAKERLAEEDEHSHFAAALRGRILGYRDCRALLQSSARFRPRLLGDPDLAAASSSIAEFSSSRATRQHTNAHKTRP